MRPAFAFQDGIVYLNHGAFGATPRRVLDAQTGWRAQVESQPIDFLWRRLPGLLAAADLAAFVGARPRDIVFAENATSAINAVIRSLALGPGHEVLFTSSAHPGSRKPLAYAASRSGVHLVEVELGPETIRSHNRRLCEQAAGRLVERLGLGSWKTGLPLPPSMRCAMMTLPVPIACRPDREAAIALNHELWTRYRIEVPIVPYGGRCWFRISAQIYNTLDDYDRLADAFTDLGARGWAG